MTPPAGRACQPPQWGGEPYPALPRHGLYGPPRPLRPHLHWQRRPVASSGFAPCPPLLDNSSSGACVTAAPEGGRGAPYPALPRPGRTCVAHLGHTGPPDTPPCPPHGDGAFRLGPGGPPHDPGRPPPAPTGTAHGLHTGGIPVSRPGPPEILWQDCPLALGRRDGDTFRRGNCDGRKRGPHTRGTSSLPVKRRHVHSRHGRSDSVLPKRPLALAREMCSTDAYLKSFRWRSTCDCPVTHQPQWKYRVFRGTSKSPGRPPVKGLILCKPALDL